MAGGLQHTSPSHHRLSLAHGETRPSPRHKRLAGLPHWNGGSSAGGVHGLCGAARRTRSGESGRGARAELAGGCEGQALLQRAEELEPPWGRGSLTGLGRSWLAGLRQGPSAATRLLEQKGEPCPPPPGLPRGKSEPAGRSPKRCREACEKPPCGGGSDPQWLVDRLQPSPSPTHP